METHLDFLFSEQFCLGVCVAILRGSGINGNVSVSAEAVSVSSVAILRGSGINGNPLALAIATFSAVGRYPSG